MLTSARRGLADILSGTRPRDLVATAVVIGVSVVAVVTGVGVATSGDDAAPASETSVASRTVAVPHAPASAAPERVWPYRPPGGPTYFPGERFGGPRAMHGAFGLRVEPYRDLRVGDRFSVTMTIDNAGTATAGIAQFWVHDGVTVRVVDAGDGEVDKVDDHGSPRGYRVAGVAYRRTFAPGRTELRAVLEITGFRCLGGGDFVADVLGAFGRPFVTGANNGDHLIWLDNDPPASGAPTCRSESVPSTAVDRAAARR